MWPFRRRLSVDFIPVVQEPSRAELPDLPRPPDGIAAVALIDSVLDGQKAHHPEDRNVELIDVLLDLRNLLRVPIIPGRSS